jgi:hypothetical protein
VKANIVDVLGFLKRMEKFAIKKQKFEIFSKIPIIV